VNTNSRDEQLVESYFHLCGLMPIRFSKQEKQRGRTPDFKVACRAGRTRFFYEVKTIEHDPWEAGGRPDPIYNRLSADIHTAVKQLDAVNPGMEFPKVLAFVNHDRSSGLLDVFTVFTGRGVDSAGNSFLLYPQFSEGRIRTEKLRLNLFLWFDARRPLRQRLWTATDRAAHEALCALFGAEPAPMLEGADPIG
jgi:hypothetical protein